MSRANASALSTHFSSLCNTKRLLELADFCGPDLEDLTGCRCPTAGDLLAEGALTCARPDQKNSSPPACPTGCPVCEFCMVLEGCEDIYDC